MSYTPLANCYDGQLLGAGYLNSLSRNAAWLYGAANAANMPFQGYRNTSIAEMDDTTVQWLLRRRLRYLHFRVSVGAALDHIRLCAKREVTTHVLYEDTSPGATQTFNGVVDMDATALSVGGWYRFWWEIKFDSGSHLIAIRALAESDKNSLGTSSSGSYVVPQQWARGDTVSAANLNKYKGALDAAHGLLGDDRFVWAVRQNNTEDRGYFLNNTWRWLHYVGTGNIVDAADVGEDVTLTGSGLTVQTYDLQSVDWLTPGMLYEVKDAMFAVEDYEA